MRIEGTVAVPGDKSITHRALMLAAAAEGESRLSGLLPGADCKATAAVLRALGCDIPPLPSDGAEIVVRSPGMAGWRSPDAPLDCGNSGTTARLMMGLLAGRPLRATLTGDGSLRARPMRRITDPLREMGAGVREMEAPDRLPIEIRGRRLRPYRHRSGQASAQVKSAVLLAGLSGGVEVAVTEPHRSRDHTERMLRAMGVAVDESETGDGWRVVADFAEAGAMPLNLRVPGDFSSAAFWVALALLADAGELHMPAVGVNPTRTGLLATLTRMGADVTLEKRREEGGEPVAHIVARPSPLGAVTVDAAEIPAAIDEIPVLAVLAARARGTTRIRGAAELRVKETDRLAALAANLRALDLEVVEHPDGLDITGTSAALSGEVRSFGDHRIAMAFGVLGALPHNEIEIDDPAVVAVSYPDFWPTLRALAGGKATSSAA